MMARHRKGALLGAGGRIPAEVPGGSQTPKSLLHGAHATHNTQTHGLPRHAHTFQHANQQPVPQGTHTCRRIHTPRLPPNPQTQPVPYSLPHQHTHIQPVPKHTVCSYTRLLPSRGAPWSYGTLPQHLTPSAVPGQHLPTVTPTVGSKGRGLDGQVLPSSMQPGSPGQTSPLRSRKRKGLLLILLQF